MPSTVFLFAKVVEWVPYIKSPYRLWNSDKSVLVVCGVDEHGDGERFWR